MLMRRKLHVNRRMATEVDRRSLFKVRRQRVKDGIAQRAASLDDGRHGGARIIGVRFKDLKD